VVVAQVAQRRREQPGDVHPRRPAPRAPQVERDGTTARPSPPTECRTPRERRGVEQVPSTRRRRTSSGTVSSISGDSADHVDTWTGARRARRGHRRGPSGSRQRSSSAASDPVGAPRVRIVAGEPRHRAG
jgi:hypothetical protein